MNQIMCFLKNLIIFVLEFSDTSITVKTWVFPGTQMLTGQDRTSP